MKQYTLDCEFNSYRGGLLSLALYSPEESLYIVVSRHDRPREIHPWVQANVMDKIMRVPTPFDTVFPQLVIANLDEIPALLEKFFLGKAVQIFSDWPDDVKFLSELILTGPGSMIKIPSIDFAVRRVDAYPTSVEGAEQHHAWWDAYVLYEHLNDLARQAHAKERGVDKSTIISYPRLL